MTTAVIFSGGNFVADILEKKIKEQGIRVIKGDYEEIPENSAYFFDFVGDPESWKALKKNQRLVLIKVNETSDVSEWKEKLEASDLNWRIVVGENVYGEGMEEVGFLGRAFALAASNKNLILPSLMQNFRVLAADDFVEAILRSCFFSGTSGKMLLIGGKETNSKAVAETLIDEAKMTKTQVIQDETILEDSLSDKLVKESQELLRWQAEVLFKDGAKVVVQYFVAKVDQENRKKTTTKNSYSKPQASREAVVKRYEVEVENYVEEKPDSTESNVEEKDEIEEEEIEYEIEKEDEEIEPVVEKKLDEKKEEVQEIEYKVPVKAKKEEESKEEFLIESFKKSPLPERKVEEKIKEVEQKPSQIITKKTTETLIKKKRFGFRKYIKWGMWGVGWVFFVIFLVNFIKLVTIPKKILRTMTMIEEGKYDEATNEIADLRKNNLQWLGRYGGGEIGTIFRIEGGVVDLLELSSNLAQGGEKLSEGLFGEKEVEMKGELDKIEKNLDEAISIMGVLQGRLSGQWSWLPGRFRDQLTKYKSELSTKRSEVQKVRKIIPILPEMLGLDGKRREYMVLLQNESELRPTGGFIGSYAILSFEGGKFLGFDVQDIYEADGQLKGHVEPPAEIKKYLGEAGWFMRDANWQASFPLSARDIQWFLEKETGRKVDGVIGLNLAAVKSVLGVTGEIFVPDFKEKINEDNLYEQAEYYSETKFFPGSVQKASFLGAVSKQLMEEIRLAKGMEGQRLLTSVMDLLERNEIQIVLNNTQAAEELAQAGWDGAMYEGKCNPPATSQAGEQACIADYLYIVEANLGVNKVNYFLYRNIERQVEIGEKIVKNTLKIAYENTAKINARPGGDYKNYMRIYVPREANVLEVNWDENGSGQKKIISGEDLKISYVGNKKEIGFLIVVPIGKKINVEMKYSENVDLSGLQKFSYLSYIQKQSGFGDTGMVTLVSMPETWQISAVEPVASIVGGKLLFNQKLDKDIKMGVEISR